MIFSIKYNKKLYYHIFSLNKTEFDSELTPISSVIFSSYKQSRQGKRFKMSVSWVLLTVGAHSTRFNLQICQSLLTVGAQSKRFDSPISLSFSQLRHRAKYSKCTFFSFYLPLGHRAVDSHHFLALTCTICSESCSSS